nr:hypothetical protein [Tanacetum cinerariifolium]
GRLPPSRSAPTVWPSAGIRRGRWRSVPAIRDWRCCDAHLRSVARADQHIAVRVRRTAFAPPATQRSIVRHRSHRCDGPDAVA